MDCSKPAAVSDVVNKYQEILKENLKWEFSNKRKSLGKPGIPNRYFMNELTREYELFRGFLMDYGLLKDYIWESQAKMKQKTTLKQLVGANNVEQEELCHLSQRQKVEALRSVICFLVYNAIIKHIWTESHLE
ncbi:uncharacterized protein LOC118193064 [Stegodyphus dumicola]|uniref:uncharacterized protein LOC118193064 n=1 Tax=Stegodyphus dumicola TaxID=202533 RepID=UPI0015A995A4|nr:uncharacterized protein LOC118193064 [Stegodyphus dumicola]